MCPFVGGRHRPTSFVSCSIPNLGRRNIQESGVTVDGIDTSQSKRGKMPFAFGAKTGGSAIRLDEGIFGTAYVCRVLCPTNNVPTCPAPPRGHKEPHAPDRNSKLCLYALVVRVLKRVSSKHLSCSCQIPRVICKIAASRTCASSTLAVNVKRPSTMPRALSFGRNGSESMQQPRHPDKVTLTSVKKQKTTPGTNTTHSKRRMRSRGLPRVLCTTHETQIGLPASPTAVRGLGESAGPKLLVHAAGLSAPLEIPRL